MNQHYTTLKHFLLTALFLALPGLCHAQHFLSKPVTIEVQRKPVSAVLKQIGAQGGFYFSYNSSIVGDSLVTLSVKNKTVKEALDMLFAGAYEYEETGKYVILQRASGQYWYATGYVVDGTTGEKVINASVYEKQQFVSTLTNEHGYFRLKLKGKLTAVTLFISRNLYYDTAITVTGGKVQDISVGISPKPMELDSFVVRSKDVEQSWFSKLFLSSKQRVQSVNLGKYFVDKPYQASIIPGLGSHGRMSTQVVNKFSFNMVGGYTAGVNGFELGGVFNIVKHDVRYAQVAGALNIVGGNVNGVQIAGLYNQVLEGSTGWQFAGVCNFISDSLKGIQVSGVYNHIWGSVKGAQVTGVANLANGNTDGVQVSGVGNYARGSVEGTQITGVHNHATGDVTGTQISGVVNYSRGNVTGSQITGVANFTNKKLEGVQIAGVFNYTSNLKGVQVGLINIADTSSGVGIGLLNFVWKGYHKLTVSTNEVLNVNAALKLGNKKLYNILFAGLNAGSFQRAFSFGYGWGWEQDLSKRFTLNPELSAQHLYLGDWQHANLLFKAQLNLNYKVNKWIALNAGPSYNYYHSTQTVFTDGYRKDVRNNGMALEHHRNDWSSWLGWSAGVTFF